MIHKDTDSELVHDYTGFHFTYNKKYRELIK